MRTWTNILLLLAVGWAVGACNDGAPFAKAYRVHNRAQTIGGEAALVDLGDYVIENDQIRIGVPEPGNSVGPGVFGGSLIDADLQRSDPLHRAGRGLDQFTELFPVGNLAIPAVCVPDRNKEESFCGLPRDAIDAKVEVICDGSKPCLTCFGRDDCRQKGAQINLELDFNQDYADPDNPELPGPAAPSEGAAVLRVSGMSGNYLEALGLVSIARVKMNFRMRNDFILEPGASHVRIRTMLIEANLLGGVLHESGRVALLPSLSEPLPLFGLLLGSDFYTTELPDMDPGIAGGDFLFFGDRLDIFAPGIGFDVYRDIRNKFAVGDDPLNNPIAADFLSAVGKNVSYAIGSAEPGGRYLLPLFSGAVTAGFTHAAHCHQGPCQGTPEQCALVIDCSQIKSYVFERLFAVGHGDVASAAAPILEARGVPLGTLRGHVIDARDGAPVHHAEVHVYPVPATMAECRMGGSASAAWNGSAATFEADCLAPRDYLGAVNHLRTDPAVTDLPAGQFSGRLPAGRYFLVAKLLERPLSRVEEVTIRQGEKTEVTLSLKPPARLVVEVRDESDQLVPAKLTIGQCLPNCALRYGVVCAADADCASGKCVELAGGARRCQIDNCAADRLCNPDSRRCEARKGCEADSQCEPVERCQSGQCVCKPSYRTNAALGEGTFPDGIGPYAYAPHGRVEVELPAGSWEVLASRGFEYSIDRQQVQAVSGRSADLALRVRRVVDTSGWISGDFHVHGQNSYDAVVSHRDRVINFAGEGVELLSTSDHDYVTDLSPYVFELGLEKWVKSQVGLELTTIELGHWLGFPVKYEEWQGGERNQEQGAIDWTGKFPDMLQDELRELGRYSPEETVVVVAHPRDSFFGYFDQYGLSAYDPNDVVGTLFEYLPPLHENPLARPEYFSGTFDALELFNSKRFELIRTPSVGEMRDYNLARQIIQAESAKGAAPAVVESQLIALDQSLIKDVLKRTPAEQDAIWTASGAEECQVYTFCTADGDCDASQGEVCDRVAMACIVPCAQDADCSGRPCLDGRCDRGWTPGDTPCTSEEGVVDDWFRLIDYGVVRTGMGNSDTHKLFSQTEGGLPRNFIRLEAETAKAIDLRAANRAVKQGALTTSYGPFVEVWLGDTQIGDPPLSAAGRQTVPLRVRVQSPEWFDVDRVEIYRSGRLIHVLTASGDEVEPDLMVDTSGLAVPNRAVVNLDATIEETVPEADAWYVVIAMGLDGRDLSPIYTEHPFLKLQIGDILTRSFSSVPLPFDLSAAAVPRVFRVYPYAVANPVFLDVDGNGAYDAPHETPAWASGSTALGSASFPLSSERLGDGPLADPADPITMRARQLRHFMYLLHQGFEHGRAR